MTKFIRYFLAVIALTLLTSAGFAADNASLTSSSIGELRIFTCGHSFHIWMPGWLQQIEALTDIKGHKQVGSSSIGGSRVIRHWDAVDEKHNAKAVVATGQMDVLTLSPMLSPDEGIDKFASLAVEHNPNIRVTIQEFWLPFDRLDCFGEKSHGEQAKTLRDWEDPPLKDPKNKADTSHFDVPNADQIDKLHAPYFQMMNAYVVEENKKLGK